MNKATEAALRRQTPFRQKVYRALLTVPPGKVTTYGLLADTIKGGSAQAVGQALRNNPLAPDVPCHRVVASNGTLGGFSGQRSGPQLERKRRLLEAEGVRFVPGSNSVNAADIVPPALFSPKEGLVLEEINARVANGNSLEAVMAYVFDATQEILPCDRMSVALLEDENRLVARWTATRYGKGLIEEGFAQDISQSSLRNVLETGRPRVIRDLNDYRSKGEPSRSLVRLRQEEIRSSITCPLRVGDRPVGVLFVSSLRAGAYDEHAVDLLVAMVSRLSQAVDKAYRLDRLRAAQKGYLEMLGFVSHEIKGPVASMLMDGRLLTDGYVGPLSDKQQEVVKRMLRRADYLMGLVKDYLDLSRVEGGELSINAEKGVDLDEAVIGPAAELISAAVRDKNMAITRLGETGVHADVDPDLLKIVFVNLLTNAAKYGTTGTEIEIETATTDAHVIVRIRNQGTGFRPEDRNNLFRRFSRLDVPAYSEVKGTGVGLYTTWRIIRLHNGTIDANSEYGKWAEFQFTIPRTEHS